MPADLDLVDVLKLLAKRYRGRVSGLNLHDPNVCTSTFDWREAIDVRPVPLDRFRHRLKMKYKGQPMEIYSNNRFIVSSLDVTIVCTCTGTRLRIAAKPATEWRDLPNEFRPLVKLMKAWSWGDDQERSDRLAKAPRERLQRMINEVESHFRSINAYLDGFGDDAISESAAALGTLAEAASEAQLILEGRDRPGLRRSAHQGHRRRRKLRSL